MIRHTLLYFFMRAGTGLLAIATLAIFTRFLSPQEYGVYALVMAIATTVSAILFQWINIAFGRFYAMYQDSPKRVMGAITCGFWVTVLLAAPFFVLIFHFRSWFDLKFDLYLPLFLIIIALGRYSLALQIVNSQRLPTFYGMISWAKSGITLLVGFILIHYGLGSKGALLGGFVGIILAIAVSRTTHGLKIQIDSLDMQLSLQMFRYGFPLTLNFLAILVVDMADRFMIGGLLGSEYVAPYAVSYDFVQQVIGPITNIFFLAAFPMIIQTFEAEGEMAVRVRLRSLANGLICIGLPVTFIFCLLSNDISKIIFGTSYHQDVARIMPWLAVAIFVGCVKSYFFDIAFQLLHATQYQVYIAMAMAIVNVILNLFLLPRHGVIAAAWATLAAFFLGAVMSWWIGRRIFLLPSLGNNLPKCLVACAVTATILYLLPSSEGVLFLLERVVLSMSVYLIMAWLLNMSNFRDLFNTIVFKSIQCMRKFSK